MESTKLLFDTVKKTAKHSLIYGLGTSFAAVSGIILIPIYTRFLAPGDYGIYALVNLIFSLLFFLYDFGMVNALFRWYYQYTAHEVEMRRSVINTAFIFLLVLASFFTLIFWSAAPLLSSIIFKTDKYAILIKLMLIGVFLQSLTWVPMSILRIRAKVTTFTSVVITGMVLMIGANFYLLSIGRGIRGIYEAYIIAYLFMVLALYLITRREYGATFSFTELKGMLKFGLPYIPVLFFSWAIDFIDRYLLGQLSTLQQVGLYAVGYRIGQAMYLVEKTFLIAWVPLMLSLHQEHKEKAQEIFGKVFTYYILTIFFLCLGVSVFSREIMRIFTSPAYFEAARVIPWIAFSYLLNGIYIFMLSSLIISKNVYVQPIILLISAALNIALNILLIPPCGMMGSAYATILSYLVVAGATYFFAQKFYPIAVEPGRVLKVFISAAAVFAISTLIDLPSIMLSAGLKAALMAAFVYILYLAGFFNQTEIDKLKMIFVKRERA